MKLFRVIISIDVEAEDEDKACQEAMNIVCDDTMTIESIVERISFPKEDNNADV